MSASQPNITIRFKVDIPVGVTARIEQERPGESAPPFPQKYDDSDVVAKDPDGTVPKAVRPRTDSALGYICGWITFNTTVSDVWAKIYPESKATPHPPIPNGAVPGTRTSGNTYVWQDGLPAPGGPLPLTDHLRYTPYPPNTFVVWYKKGGVWCQTNTVTFSGMTGTTGFCGSGSAPSLVGGYASAVQSSTFSAFWCVEISGFSGPSAHFNNLHALRHNRSAALPTWDNQGDGKTAPRVELRYNPQGHQWTLKVEQGGHGFTAQAVSPSPFGPLLFTTGQTLSGAALELPRVIATPI